MDWTIGSLDYFLDYFLDLFFGPLFGPFIVSFFWTIFFLDHFIGGHTISTQGRVGYSLSVLREG